MHLHAVMRVAAVSRLQIKMHKKPVPDMQHQCLLVQTCRKALCNTIAVMQAVVKSYACQLALVKAAQRPNGFGEGKEGV